MIVFDLLCAHGHGFEGWFASSDDFADQQQAGLLACPQCGCDEVTKAPMAPAVSRKGNQLALTPSAPTKVADAGAAVANVPMPPEVQAALRHLAEAQARALENSTWVGGGFVDQARAMHYGERDHAPIHGQATKAEAEVLADEGVAVAPLLFPVTPPDELN